MESLSGRDAVDMIQPKDHKWRSFQQVRSSWVRKMRRSTWTDFPTHGELRGKPVAQFQTSQGFQKNSVDVEKAGKSRIKCAFHVLLCIRFYLTTVDNSINRGKRTDFPIQSIPRCEALHCVFAGSDWLLSISPEWISPRTEKSLECTLY